MKLQQTFSKLEKHRGNFNSPSQGLRSIGETSTDLLKA
jgi:hypothetical protein